MHNGDLDQQNPLFRQLIGLIYFRWCSGLTLSATPRVWLIHWRNGGAESREIFYELERAARLIYGIPHWSRRHSLSSTPATMAGGAAQPTSFVSVRVGVAEVTPPTSGVSTP